MMRGSTGLNSNKAGWQRFQELEQLFAPDRTIEDNCAIGGDTVNLENFLPKIQSYSRNFRGGAPFLADENICTMPHCATFGCRRHPLQPRSVYCRLNLRRAERQWPLFTPHCRAQDDAHAAKSVLFALAARKSNSQDEPMLLKNSLFLAVRVGLLI